MFRREGFGSGLVVGLVLGALFSLNVLRVTEPEAHALRSKLDAAAARLESARSGPSVVFSVGARDIYVRTTRRRGAALCSTLAAPAPARRPW